MFELGVDVMKYVLGCVRKACEDYNLIEDGDKIAVGVSGGKDSILLLYALNLYKKFAKQSFEICAITVTLGLEPFDLTGTKELCKELDIEYKIIPSNIGEVLFDIRKEKNPCSLCAKIRKGIIYEAANEMGCNKVAYAHHREDMIETFLLSIFYEGRLNTFSPKSYLSRSDLTLIRPLIYLEEEYIRKTVKKLELPVTKNPCPADGHTKRQYIKDLLKNIENDIPDARGQMLKALRNTEGYNLLDKGKKQ